MSEGAPGGTGAAERRRWRLGRWATRKRQARVVLACLPLLLRERAARRALAEMRRFCRRLPDILDRPLPEAMGRLTPGGDEEPGASSDPPPEVAPPEVAGTSDCTSDRAAIAGRVGACDEDATRRLADLAALLERRSPVGKCLRRSALRYHFLRRLGLPLRLHLGAGLRSGEGDRGRRLAAHAWVTLNGEPYHEAPEDLAGYRSIAVWPETAE